MRFETLEQWLEWQMVLHDKAIDLGLERVQQVGDNLGLDQIAGQVITIAGTNGKGSSVAAYENWMRRAGYTVASYTSPHLLKYNERVKRNLETVSDAELCRAFAAVDAARDDIALTYFEFGTLAALFLIQQWQPDYAILEVGLGGRLDAVNIIDADLVHLTPIGIDHQSWLGESREQIGFEKAGVLRAEIPVIVNDPDPPQSVLAEIERLHCECLRLGQDYTVAKLADDQWLWQGNGLEFQLDSVLPGSHQMDNLAGVVAGLSCLVPLADFERRQVREFFHETRLQGRFELIPSPLACQLYLDVGHNHGAAKALASSLKDISQPGKTVVLLGMLEDKQTDLFVEELNALVDAWWLLTLDCDRGLSARQLHDKIEALVSVEKWFDNATNAMDHALSSLGNQDIMLVTGSFVTVEHTLRALSESGEQNKYG